MKTYLFLLVGLSWLHFSHAQTLTCSALPDATYTGSCGIADLGTGNGCKVGVRGRCVVKLDNVCVGVVKNPPLPAGTGLSILASAKRQSGGGEDWQTFIGTHITANGSVNTDKSAMVEDCSSLGCTFNGSPVADGASVTAYLSNTVPYGSSCTAAGNVQTRTCSNNVMSGSYPYSSCAILPATNCSSPALNDGQTATFYSRQCVDSTDSCSNYAQSRTCNAGTVSGSSTYSFTSCSAAPGQSCSLAGQTVADGAGRNFYSATSVAYGGSCSSVQQYRNCTNGIFDGSASYDKASCSVAPGANCAPVDGVTVNHGSSRTFYQAASAATCTGQTRTCTNGSLSGSYAYASCSTGCGATTAYWSGNGPGGPGSCDAPLLAGALNEVRNLYYDDMIDTVGSATYTCTSTGWVKNSSSCGMTCFVAGTKVSMANGELKNIEDVKIGEIVRTFDEAKGITTYSAVSETQHHEERPQVLFTFSLANGKMVTSNDVHPFYVVEYHRYLSAQQIYDAWKPDDRLSLFSEEGKAVVINNITRREDEVKTYNLHVSSPYDVPGTDGKYNHNYYAEGVLVHNIKANGPGGGGGCFIAGTQVTMADGTSRNIESLLVGEIVKTYDEVTGEYTLSPVKTVYHHEPRQQILLTYHLNNGVVFTSNDVHPIFDRSTGAYHNSIEIYERWEKGEVIRLEDETGKELVVEKIVLTESFVPVYNLHVSSPYDVGIVDGEHGHNYFVYGVRVHNAVVAK